MLKRNSRINETTVKENPTGRGIRNTAIAECHLDSSPGKGREVYPREGAAVAAHFFFDDPTTRLRHG
jgi:hypothetical protein